MSPSPYMFQGTWNSKLDWMFLDTHENVMSKFWAVSTKESGMYSHPAWLPPGMVGYHIEHPVPLIRLHVEVMALMSMVYAAYCENWMRIVITALYVAMLGVTVTVVTSPAWALTRVQAHKNSRSVATMVAGRRPTSAMFLVFVV